MIVPPPSMLPRRSSVWKSVWPCRFGKHLRMPHPIERRKHRRHAKRHAKTPSDRSEERPLGVLPPDTPSEDASGPAPFGAMLASSAESARGPETCPTAKAAPPELPMNLGGRFIRIPPVRSPLRPWLGGTTRVGSYQSPRTGHSMWVPHARALRTYEAGRMGVKPDHSTDFANQK